MGSIIVFLIGLIFGIILMGLCISSSERDMADERRKLHDTGGEKECYCDKE